MQRFMGLLLGVWREACSQIAISESVCRIAPLLCERLPIRTLLVQRVDLRHCTLQRVAAANQDGACGNQHVATPCTRQQLDDLLAWGHSAELKRWPAG
ncbi:MAG: hypothetical protein JXO22_08205, partial [Phycisphaerae bacterium]|nr:hypothetical protein [Phycisphaerae bacterium]